MGIAGFLATSIDSATIGLNHSAASTHTIAWMALAAILAMSMAWFGKEQKDADRPAGDFPPYEPPANVVPPDGVLPEDFERLLLEPIGHMEAPEGYRFPPPDGFENDEQLLLAIEEYNRAASAHWFAARRFDELFAGLPIPCFGYDREGTIFEWNRAAESLWGYASYDVFQRSVFECVLDPGTEELFQGIIERVFNGETVQGAEFELCMPDGTNRWLTTYTYPLHTHSGQIVGALTAAIDTSDRNRNHVAGNRTTQFTPAEKSDFDADFAASDYLDALPDPVLIVDLVGRRVCYANQHAVRLISPHPEEPIELSDIATRLQSGDARKLLRSLRKLQRGDRSSDQIDVVWTDSDVFIEFSVSLSVCRKDPLGRRLEVMVVGREVPQANRPVPEPTLLSALADTHGSGVAVADSRGVIQFANEKFARLAGWPGREMKGVPISEVLQKIPAEFGENGTPSLAGRSEIRVEGDGPQWLEIRFSPIPCRRHADEDPGAFLVTLVDISQQKAFELQVEAHLLELNETRLMLEIQSAELEQVNQQLQGLALLDGLTGIHNHRAFRDRLAAVLQHCRLTHRPLSLLMIDVDRFKHLNDTHGHPVGDRVLVQIAQVLTTSVRGTDFVARYGGEEFAVLLPFCPAERSVEVAERIRSAIAGQDFPVGRVTVSIGVSTASPENWIGEDRLIELADQALYRAKRGGRNFVFHADDTEFGRDSA